MVEKRTQMDSVRTSAKSVTTYLTTGQLKKYLNFYHSTGCHA